MTTPPIPRRLRSIPKKPAALQSIETSLTRLVAELVAAAAAMESFIVKIEHANKLPKGPDARLKWARDLAAVERTVKNAQAVVAPLRRPGRSQRLKEQRQRIGARIFAAPKKPRPVVVPIVKGAKKE